MIFLDTICINPDRHTNNFGLLRNSSTGEVIALAPNFDNNMALIAKGYPKKATENDVLVRLFNELLDAYPQYRKVVPVIDEELIKEVLEDMNMKVRKKDIVDIIMSRYNLIR